MNPLDVEQEQIYKKNLSSEQYYVLRQKGTERPFTGKYWDHSEVGTYTCAACNSPLFHSNEKFQSGCGWPSFSKELTQHSILTQEDLTHNMPSLQFHFLKNFETLSD